MTYEGTVRHVYVGRKRADRLEVVLDTMWNGKPFLLDDAYLWLKAGDYRNELVATLLQGVQHTGERVRVQVESSVYGNKVVWAEKVEAPAKVLAFKA